MDVGYISIVFFVLGVVLLLAEAVIPGGIAGTIGASLIGGAIAGLLFPQHYWVAFTIAAAVVALASSLILISIYRRMHHWSGKEVMSASTLIDRDGVVTSAVDPSSMNGKVSLDGDIWTAQSDEVLPPGTPVVVIGVKGVRVIVRRKAS